MITKKDFADNIYFEDPQTKITFFQGEFSRHLVVVSWPLQCAVLLTLDAGEEEVTELSSSF